MRRPQLHTAVTKVNFLLLAPCATVMRESVSFVKKNGMTDLFFKLTAEGVAGDIDFGEVYGINVSFENGEPVNTFIHQLPKQVHQNLVLKRGACQRSPLFDWIINSLESFTPLPAKTLLLTILNTNGNALVKWEFQNARPVKVEVSDSNTPYVEISIETVELIYDLCKRL